MAKIIKVNGDFISIGTDDGGIKEVRAADINFVPFVGDEVELYEKDNTIIVNKKGQNRSENTINSVNVNNNSQPVYIANNKKSVNKIVYCVLAFLLGGIGVHKFYAGKVGTGILFILFCWTFIPAIIAFIDFIIGLCKTADQNGNILV